MSRLTDLYKKIMYGQDKPTMFEGFENGVPYFTGDDGIKIKSPYNYTEDNAPSLEPTKGLFGTGGEKTGGLIDFNKMNNQPGGLLKNIPETALLGSAIFGQGLKGKDPFSALLPAATQTAQFKKLLAPKNKDNFRLLSKSEVASVPGLDINKAYQMNTVTKKIVPVSGVGGTNINMNTVGENEFSKLISKADVADVVELRENAKTAINQNTDLSLITALSANLKTGAGGVLLQDLAKIGERFGVDMNWLSDYGQSQTIANSEAVQVLASNVTLDAISKTKGSISDKEMTFFQSIAPNLGMTNEGIHKTAFIKEKLNNRTLEKNNFMEQWISDGTRPTSLKNTPFGKKTFNEFWSLWVEQKDKEGNLVNPIFTENELQELREANSVQADNVITDKSGNKFIKVVIPGQPNKYLPLIVK